MESVGLGNRPIMPKNLPRYWDGVTFDMNDLSVRCVIACHKKVSQVLGDDKVEIAE